MLRRPRPSLVTTTLPALATLFAACQHESPHYPPPQLPHNPPALPPEAPDAGGVTSLEPTPIDPRNIPPMPLAGAPVMVSPHPSLGFRAPSPAPSPAPAPAPSPAPRSAPARAAAPVAAPSPAPVLPPEQTALQEITPETQGLALAVETSGLEPGMYLLHRHAPGTPCRPVSRTEIEQLAAGARPKP